MRKSWQISVLSGFKEVFLKIFPAVLPKHILSIFQCIGKKGAENKSLVCFLRANGRTGKNICGYNSLKISHLVS